MAEPRDTAADEEKDTYDVRLKNALQNLRSAKKDYHCIVNLAKPADLFWLDRNPVSAKHRLMLTGLTGSKNFSKAGTARRVDNTLVLDIPGAGQGMAGRIQTAIVKAGGPRLKVMLGGEVAEEADAAPAADAPPTAKSAAGIALAPQAWRGTHEAIAQRIGLLKDSVRKHYGPQGAQMLAAIDRQLAQLDAVTDKLDKGLADALAAVAKAPEDQRRQATARAARQAADYIAWVQKDPIVRHIDGNPFGVPTRIQETVSRSLGEIAKSLAAA